MGRTLCPDPKLVLFEGLDCTGSQDNSPLGWQFPSCGYTNTPEGTEVCGTQDGSACWSIVFTIRLKHQTNRDAYPQGHNSRTGDKVWARSGRLEPPWTLRSRPGYGLAILPPTGSSPGIPDNDKRNQSLRRTRYVGRVPALFPLSNPRCSPLFHIPEKKAF